MDNPAAGKVVVTVCSEKAIWSPHPVSLEYFQIKLELNRALMSIMTSIKSYLDGVNDPGDDYGKYDVAHEVGSLRYRPRNDSCAGCRKGALFKGHNS